jgi:hypothetical protein
VVKPVSFLFDQKLAYLQDQQLRDSGQDAQHVHPFDLLPPLNLKDVYPMTFENELMQSSARSNSINTSSLLKEANNLVNPIFNRVESKRYHEVQNSEKLLVNSRKDDASLVKITTEESSSQVTSLRQMSPPFVLSPEQLETGRFRIPAGSSRSFNHRNQSGQSSLKNSSSKSHVENAKGSWFSILGLAIIVISLTFASYAIKG